MLGRDKSINLLGLFLDGAKKEVTMADNMFMIRLVLSHPKIRLKRTNTVVSLASILMGN
jgi:hypothetical protein